jgi:subtilisin family serine protease
MAESFVKVVLLEEIPISSRNLPDTARRIEMKLIKIITYLTLIAVVPLGSSYSQSQTGSGQRFYYAYDERIALTPVADKVVVTLMEKTEPLDLNSLLNKSALNSGDYNIEALDNRTFQLNSAANKVSHLMKLMRDNPAVHTLQPVYSTNAGAELGITDEIVVEFLPGVSQGQKKQLHRSLGVTAKKSKKYYDLLSVAIHGDALAVANAYQESGLVKYAHPNFLVDVELDGYLPNDEYFDKQFALHNLGRIGPKTINGYYGTFDADVDAPEAWEITKGNPDIVIAIYDRGVSLDHPDLNDNIWINPNEVLGDANLDGSPGISGVDDDGDGLVDEDSQGKQPGEQGYTNDLLNDDDENGYSDDFNGWDFKDNDNDPSPALETLGPQSHGNACAGIIVAEQDNNEGITGIAPLCKIMPLRRGSNSEEICVNADAIYYALENGADVFSQSVSYAGAETWFPIVEAAIEYATTLGRDGLGMVMCFSAGNTAKRHLLPPYQGHVKFPAKVDVAGVITVGASNRHDFQSNYSPSSPLIDIVAPSAHAMCWDIEEEGGEIWTTDTPGELGYNLEHPICRTGHARHINVPSSGMNHTAYYGAFGGTSAATPLVAGIAALLLSVDPDLTQLEVYFLLTQTADKVGPYNYVNGRCDEMGFGRVNAFKALSAIGMPQNLILQNITVKSGTASNWVAGNSITAAGAGTFFTVEWGGNAKFSAGDRINLRPGFAAYSGSQFYAGVAGAGQIASRFSCAWNGSSSIASGPQIGGIETSNPENKELAAKKGQNLLHANIPREFNLSQNFPNPFNPTTTIRYALKEDVRVKLAIYNMLGQEVRTLVNEHQPAGFKEVVWEGTNDNGQRVASGIYIYRIVAGNYIDLKKMILLK